MSDPRSVNTSSTSLWLGVDGGGTKTRVSAVDAQGRVVASVVGGSTNPNSVGSQARWNLRCVLLRAMLRAQCGAHVADSGDDSSLEGSEAEEAKLKAHRPPVDVSDVRRVVLAMAGVDRPADVQNVKSWIEDLLPNIGTHFFLHFFLIFFNFFLLYFFYI